MQINLYSRTEDITIGQGADVLNATRKLLAEVEKSITGKKRATIEWRISAFGYVCDGCKASRPAVHPDWHHEPDGTDWCPSCLPSARSAAQEGKRG